MRFPWHIELLDDIHFFVEVYVMQSSREQKRESVWDYPRPHRVEQSSRRICAIFNGTCVAESNRAVRVLETSHPLPSTTFHPVMFKNSSYRVQIITVTANSNSQSLLENLTGERSHPPPPEYLWNRRYDGYES
jgi:hypothetical protein